MERSRKEILSGKETLNDLLKLIAVEKDSEKLRDLVAAISKLIKEDEEAAGKARADADNAPLSAAGPDGTVDDKTPLFM